MRVIGTAGHVDHGKSTLIHALTGIDPDRLQEEKERGMTIDLGFAWLRLPSGQEVSIVDVPGHERFIKNMLAGVGGIDIALLVVAADEGVMPQTREHLAILDLLGIETGVVALTKSDLVDEDWLDLVTAEVEETLASTTLARAPLVPVSATTRQGLDILAVELDRLLAAERHRRQTGRPRLPIDRVFTMAGFGTVVTGTLIDGELRVGQEMEILPSGRRVRIRGLQSHRKRVDVAPAGTRVAANLSGISTDDIERGAVLTSTEWLQPTRAVDARLRLVPDAPKPLPHNAFVSFHTGSLEALGRVALLDRDRLEPGETGWAQIRLDRPVTVVKGDPFILRLPAPNLTVGGGTIVDEHPRRHRRFQERVLSQLAILEGGTPEERALQTLQAREPIELRELAARLASTPEEARAILLPMLAAGSLLNLAESGRARARPSRNAAEKPLTLSPSKGRGGSTEPALSLPKGSPRAGPSGPPRLFGHPASDAASLPPAALLVSREGWDRLGARVQSELQTYHRDHPLRRGMPGEELRTRLGQDTRVFTSVERTLLAQRVVVQDGPFLRLPQHGIRLSDEQDRQVEALTRSLLAAGPSPPSRSELRAQHGVSDELLQVLIDRGSLVEVSSDLLYPEETYQQMVSQITQMIRDRGKVTVAEVRDAFATSRKFALAILEHLDERKVTRRVGDERVLA